MSRIKGEELLRERSRADTGRRIEKALTDAGWTATLQDHGYAIKATLPRTVTQ